MLIYHKQNGVWKELWISIIRNIWDRRNIIVFKDARVDAQLKAWLYMKFNQ